MLFSNEVEVAKQYLEVFSSRIVPKRIDYFLVMRDKSGVLSYHDRINQPCWGELRKYRSTHYHDCTKLEDARPEDLFSPFPDGTPEAIGIPFSCIGALTPLKQYLFSNESPWRKGFGSSSDIILTWTGIILKNTDIDPTVLVNLLINIRNMKQYNETEKNFEKFLAEGLTKFESAFLCIFSGVSSYSYAMPSNVHRLQVPPPNDYINTLFVSLSRLYEQNPHDLTGGTLRNRFDYERKKIKDIFYDSNGVNITKVLNDECKGRPELFDRYSEGSNTYYLKASVAAKIMKRIMKEQLEKA